MDPVELNTTVDQLVKLFATGNVPEGDFSIAEIEGRIAGALGTDISARKLVSALGFLGVKRKSAREWDRNSFEQRVALQAKGKAPAAVGATNPA